MKTLNIAMYFFSDIDGILESLLKHPSPIKIKPFFIDPYPAKSHQWETKIALYTKNNNGLARLNWNHMETNQFTSFNNLDDLSNIFPYANKTELATFIKSSEEGKELPVNFYESIFMAQRTLAGLKSHIELITYIRQAHQFWVNYLKSCKIDTLISTNVPHAFTDFLLTEACRTLGIPCICADVVNLSRGAYYIDLTTGVHLRNPEKRDGTIELLELEDSINNMSESSKINTKSIYAEEVNKIVANAKREMNNFLISGTPEASFIVSEKMKLAKTYDFLVKSKPVPNDKTQYHYLFLHYQPEASSIPLAGRYADQMLAIESITSKMQRNECLIIKEHPRQFIEYGNLEVNHDHIANVLGFRNSNFYKQAISFKETYLCPRNKSVKSILQHNKTVIWSPTGSITLQAFLCGCDFEQLDTYTPYRYLIPHKTTQINKRKKIAIDTLTEYVWKSFKFDFETHTASSDAADLVINLINAAQKIQHQAYKSSITNDKL